MSIKVEEILKLKDELNALLVAHYYQKDEVYNLADIVGDSLELAKKSVDSDKELIIFCGVGFMGQSVKILAPNKRVFMPKIACCSMARMISGEFYDESLDVLLGFGIKKEELLPITYINSSAEVKAKVGRDGGCVVTSSSSEKIINHALKENKKIFFMPDRCLGVNTAKKMGLKAVVLGEANERELKEAQMICFDGFCSVHQLFSVDDIEFYRKKYPDILIAVHPECTPSVCEKADFVGSTSQIIKYVQSLPLEQKVAVGTEYNLVNRLREANTYVLSSTKPECPTMNETTLDDLLVLLKSIKEGSPINEIFVDDETSKYAKLALDRMIQIAG